MHDEAIPIDVRPAPGGLRIRWLNGQRCDYSEPFFFQTVARIRQALPPYSESETDWKTLIEEAQGLPQAEPSGIILHLCRCGSTLVSNSLRLDPGAIVLSEPAPICQLLQPDCVVGGPNESADRKALRGLLIDSALRILAQRTGKASPKIVIKGGGLDLFEYHTIRTLWPRVRCVVLIRDPLEVLMSILKRPPAWVVFRNHPRSRRMFERFDEQTSPMTMVEFSARVLGLLCRRALSIDDEEVVVVDYRSLNARRICDIGRFLRCEMPQPEAAVFEELLSNYSKVPGRQKFVADQEAKRLRVSKHAREAVQEWVWEPYAKLLSREYRGELY